ncbi:conserved hypothetical protein [Gloeothece citriformis PCC 7424]|uniref:DUF2281 domain-containing protein n=1 Tax=Gloeothece citriformis (strain PCC 7424) TaxID=65393 RepID=B7KJJ3_GLOC7|nr:hypothetical protein [Gloeothece citriformis]ACK73670.1 conserved hypothetical protein [Gloeothece citriformis PCC 7424]
MNIEEKILEKVRQLPLNQQQEVLKFTELIQQKNLTSLPSPNLNMTPEDKVKKWQKVLEKLPQKSPNLPDEALHRDTMYNDED